MQGSYRFDLTSTFELDEHVLGVLWRPRPRTGSLLNARGNGPLVDADLIQHEVIGRRGLDIPPPEEYARKGMHFSLTGPRGTDRHPSGETWP